MRKKIEIGVWVMERCSACLVRMVLVPLIYDSYSYHGSSNLGVLLVGDAVHSYGLPTSAHSVEIVF